MKTVQECLQWGRGVLVNSDTAKLDTNCCLKAASGLSDAAIMADANKALDTNIIDNFKLMIERRAQGEPIALILGHKGFWTLKLRVTKDTLVPRPETETLVEVVLAKWDKENATVVDLGTGTGAIALSLAKERPSWQLTATDVNPDTLLVAKQNAIDNQINNVEFVEGSWFGPLAGQQFDLIVSNPPYIEENDPHLQAPELSYEPIGALVSGDDGLDDIKLIIKQATQHLNPNGLLAIEHGFDQKDKIQVLFNECGFTEVETINDLAGLPRVTIGRRRM